jgi:hypothetical protein
LPVGGADMCVKTCTTNDDCNAEFYGGMSCDPLSGMAFSYCTPAT